jgi:thiosulfate reductase cytochrome b subunit
MAVSEPSQVAGAQAAPPQREVIYRHAVVVRVTHWINVLCLTLLLMSGLRLFNYHPALYWGNYGYRGVPSVVSIGSAIDPDSGKPVGVTRIAGWSFVTTGVLGVSYDSDLADLWDHVRLRVPRGEAARRYNVLQKLAYLAVVFLLLPVMVLSGLTMSPAVTAAVPGLFDLFGGRQSARTIHFLVANLLVLFVLVHVVEVFLAGVVNGMRSMITGRYVIRPQVGP